MKKPAKVPPTIRFDRTEGQAPTVDLRTALTRRHPDLLGHDPGRSYAHLIIRPRCTGCGYHCGREVGPGGWYDVFHAHQRLTPEDPWAPELAPELEYVTIGDPVAHLPAPVLLSYEKRLSLEPPVKVTDADIEFHGSLASAEREQEARRHANAERNRTKTARDWSATADAFAAILSTIEARKLTPEQRVDVAHVRVWEAESELEDSRKSLAALQANAVKTVNAIPARVRKIDPDNT